MYLQNSHFINASRNRMHRYYCSNDSQTEQDTINVTSTNELASVIQIFCDVNSVSFRKLFAMFWGILVPTSLGSVMLLLCDCLTSNVKVLHSFQELGIIYPTTKHAIPEDLKNLLLRNWSFALRLWCVWLDISLVFLKDHKYFPMYSIFNLYVLLILRSTCLYLHRKRLRGKNRVWDKLELVLHELWRLDFCCFQMYQKILLWTTSLIHHAAVHQKGKSRRMLKGRSFCFVSKLTFMGNMG